MTAFVLGSVVYLAVLFASLLGALVAFGRKYDLLASVLVALAVALVVGGVAYLYQLGEVAP